MQTIQSTIVVALVKGTVVIWYRSDCVVSSAGKAVIGQSYSVAIVVSFEGTLKGQTQVFGLLLCQFGQLDAQFVQVGCGDLFIQLHMKRKRLRSWYMTLKLDFLSASKTQR